MVIKGNQLKKASTGALFGILIIAALLLTACQPAASPNPGTNAPPQSSPTQPAGGASSQSQSVELINTSFNPKQLSVAAGTTVVWTNNDNMAHTVTADDKSFDSGNLNPGDTFKFTFTKPGTYRYYCKYHGGPDGVGMSGIITVTGK